MRRARTLRQEDLARLVGVTQETISKAERGLIRPNAGLQARIAAVLGVSPQTLFEDTTDLVGA